VSKRSATLFIGSFVGSALVILFFALFAISRAGSDQAKAAVATGPMYSTICTRPSAMTDVQWNQHLEQYKWMSFTSWPAKIGDVYRSNRGYTVYLMFDSGMGPDAKFVTNDDTVASLVKGQRVVVSATVPAIPTLFGQCSIMELVGAEMRVK
jgi:hypothetical protein